MENNSSVVILAVNSSTQDLLASIKSFKAAGVKNIMMLDSAKYGFVPVLDASVKLFHTDKALLDEIAKLDGFVYITRRFNAPKDFVQIAFGVDRKKTDAYSFTGYKLLKPVDEKLLNVEVEWFNRKPNAPRYLKNDFGDKVVDYFPETGFMVHSSRVAELGKTGVLRVFDSHVRATMAFKDAGMELVCLDSPWGRPVRLPTRNSGRKYLKADELVAIKKTIKNSTPKKQSTVSDDSAATAHTKILLEKTEPMVCTNRIDVPATAVESNGAKPVLSVIFQTHNRTATACYCLESLCKNLKYDGKIHFCICDDRSMPGHVDNLVEVLRKNGVSSFSLHFTDDRRWGLGASINNGLSWSFKFTDFVLTTEDDFLLRRRFDITPYVAEAAKPDVAGIKLAANSEYLSPVVESGHHGFKKVTGSRRYHFSQRYTFNNLVMLRHRRVYDRIGMYLENVYPEIMEMDAMFRFNKETVNGTADDLKILWPSRLKLNTYDTEWFVHIGKSTLGHEAGKATAKPYEWLANKDKALMDAGRASNRSSFFHIVIPCYNSVKLLNRCLSSISSQKDAPSTVVSVIDDMSDPSMSLELAETVCRYPFAVLMPLHDKRMAGGARNFGLDHAIIRSEYTLFLDSDDEYYTDQALYAIKKKLEETGSPDVLFMSYLSNGKPKVISEGTKPNEWAIAPWSRCTKTEKVTRFVEDRRICNDTVQYLRTIETADTKAALGTVIVKYNHDNPISGWANKSVQHSGEAVRSMLLTISDIFNEPLSRPLAKRAAGRAIRYIEDKLKPAIDTRK